MKVLFLDIDGVLNSERYHHSYEWKNISSKINNGEQKYSPHFLIDKKSIEVLNNLIKSMPDLSIIISSTWKRYGRYEQTKKYLVQNEFQFESQIIDCTPELNSLKYCRGDEIQLWLNKHLDVSNYCIVDDDNDMLSTQLENFVQINSKVGLTEEDCEEIKRILNFEDK